FPPRNPRPARAGDFAIADKTVIGTYFRQDDIPGFALLVCGPHRLRSRHRDHVGLDGGDPSHWAVSCKEPNYTQRLSLSFDALHRQQSAGTVNLAGLAALART